MQQPQNSHDCCHRTRNQTSNGLHPDRFQTIRQRQPKGSHSAQHPGKNMGRSHQRCRLRCPPDNQGTRQKAKVEIIDTANVVSMTPLTEFEYDGVHYLRQRVENNQRFAEIRKNKAPILTAARLTRVIPAADVNLKKTHHEKHLTFR